MLELLIGLLIINGIICIGCLAEKIFYPEEKEKLSAVDKQTESNSNKTTIRIHRKGA